MIQKLICCSELDLKILGLTGILIPFPVTVALSIAVNSLSGLVETSGRWRRGLWVCTCCVCSEEEKRRSSVMGSLLSLLLCVGWKCEVNFRPTPVNEEGELFFVEC